MNQNDTAPNEKRTSTGADLLLAQIMGQFQTWQENGRSQQQGLKLMDQVRQIPEQLDIHRQLKQSILNELAGTPQQLEYALDTVNTERQPVTAIEREVTVPKELEQVLTHEEGVRLMAQFGYEAGQEQAFLELLNRPVTGLNRAGRPNSGMLPVRNRGVDIPGHVKLYNQCNGLIHGGTITTPGYTLECKAYRFIKGSTWVVAGVCEQKDAEGKVIERWSTADHLKEYYSSTSRKLPEYALFCQRVYKPLKKFLFKGLCVPILTGYYLPYDKNLVVKALNIFNPKPQTVTFPDTGIPFPHPKLDSNSVISPFYNPVQESSFGYPISTPYIKIFSPSPQCRETVVFMISAFGKHLSINGGKQTENKCKWDCKTFK